MENSERDPTDYWIVTFGWGDITGTAATEGQMLDKLRHYSIGEILQGLGRISTILNRQSRKFQEHNQDQAYLCKIVFRERAEEIWRSYERNLQGSKAPSGALFHELQLINATKAALISVDPTDEVDDKKPLGDLGDALLMITDLINQQSAPTPGPTNGTDVTPEWHEFFLRTRLFNRGGHWLSSVARSHDLYLTDRDSLSGSDSYVNLPELVREVTGLAPSELWASLFTLFSHWNQADLDKNLINGRLHLDNYFSGIAIDAEQFLGHVLGPVEQVREEVNQSYSVPDLKPYHYLPLAKKPVLRIGEFCYCVSLKLLAEKLTTGLFHLFLHPNVPRETSQRFLNYHGHIVQDYVDRLLFRIYPKASGRYLDEASIKPYFEGTKVADGIILYGNAAVVLETKGTIYSLEIRATGDWEEFKRKAADIFLDSARQIDETIKGIKSGRLGPLGIASDQIKVFYPLIITLEDTGIMAPTYRFISNLFAEKGLLSSSGIRPFQNMAVAELDQLEADIVEGRSLLDLIQEKVGSEAWREDSFRNYCVDTDFMERANPFLEQMGLNLMEDSITLLEQRKTYTIIRILGALWNSIKEWVVLHFNDLKQWAKFFRR